MIIYRSSAVTLLLALGSCGQSEVDFPDAATPLGRIARAGNFSDQSAALKHYAKKGLADRQSLDREFVAAGFVKSAYFDENHRACTSYYRKSRDNFPVVMLVNICGKDVFANAGQIAP